MVSGGPSDPRPQGTAFSGAKGKPENTGGRANRLRLVLTSDNPESAAARYAWGVLRLALYPTVPPAPVALAAQSDPTVLSYPSLLGDLLNFLFLLTSQTTAGGKRATDHRKNKSDNRDRPSNPKALSKHREHRKHNLFPLPN